MEAKQIIAANDEEKFEPPMEWAREDAADTLVVYLPGFSKDKIRIQITSAKKLRLSGERTGSGTTKRRFEKEFSIPSNCDINGISGNFVEGILYVKLPRTITPAPKSTQEKLPTPTQDLASDHPQQPKTKRISGQENAARQGPKSPKEQAIKSNTTDTASSWQKKEPISDSVVDKKSEESKKISSSATAENGAHHMTQKELEKDKNKGLVDEEKKRKKVTAAGEGETGHGKDNGRGGSSLEGLVMAVKKPTRLINLAVGLLVAVVFALFVKDTIFKSLNGEPKRAEL